MFKVSNILLLICAVGAMSQAQSQGHTPAHTTIRLGDEVLKVYGSGVNTVGQRFIVIDAQILGGRMAYLLGNPGFNRGSVIQASVHFASAVSDGTDLYALEQAPVRTFNCADRIVKGCRVRSIGAKREFGFVLNVYARGDHRIAQVVEAANFSYENTSTIASTVPVETIEVMPESSALIFW